MYHRRTYVLWGAILSGLLTNVGAYASDEAAGGDWRAGYQAGRVLYEKGNTKSSLSVLRNAAAGAIREHAPELDYAQVLDSLGASYEAEGLLPDAKKAFDEALAIRLRLLPANNEDIAVSLTNLSSVYWTMVKPDDAIEYATKAKAMWEQLNQTKRREYAVAINNLLASYRLKGRVKDVKAVMEEERQVIISVVPPEDPLFAKSLSTLASAYRAFGNYDMAEKLSVEALAAAEQKGCRPAVRAFLMSGVADMKMGLGRLDEAETLVKSALQLPPDPSATSGIQRATMYRLLGSIHRQQGRNEEAETELKTALTMLDGNKTGQAEAERGVVLNCLGMVAQARNDHKQAEQYFKAAIDQLGRTFGSDEANLSAAYSNLAELYSSKHQFDKAKKLYEQVLATDREALPKAHPVIARDLNNLGVLEFNQRHLDEARDLFQRAYEAFCASVGAHSPDAALTEANLANTLSQQKQIEPARTHYVNALQTLDELWGQDNPHLMNILATYAKFCRTNQDLARAEELEVRMERIRVKNAILKDRANVKS